MRTALALLALVAAAPAAAQDEPITIAVLGSSNAAGDGPESRDSTWVNRLRAHLEETRPGSRVLNYAVNGYTTYHVLPTGTTTPGDRPRPDPIHNITQVLSLEPDVVVISLTSNDSARGYALREQQANYAAVLRAAGETPVWVTTPTPRTAISDEGRLLQIALRDWTTAHFGPCALDFWSGLARPDGTFDAATGLGAGDGVHLNDSGHALLVDRVVRSGLLGSDGGCRASRRVSE